MSKLYQYFVEGKCEEKLISVLKDNKNSLLVPGKISILNVQQEHLTQMRLRTINRNTTIILVFDTDKPNIDLLQENIAILQKCGFKEILLVFQNNNLEDELIYSTNIKRIEELLPSKSKKEFKTDFIKEKRLFEKLYEHDFDINKIWNKKPNGVYVKYVNDGKRIKK